jgi:hypothetical protein
MKKRIYISALSAAIALASCAAITIPLTAQPITNGAAINTRWVGVWQAQLEGFPGVVLTLGDDLGDLSGTIVFTAIRDGSVAGHVTHVVMHPHVDGNRLSFQAKCPGGAEDIVDMFLNLNSDGKGQLVCQKCGSAAPIAMDKIP